jgi:DNA-binding NarL/FixJ family response regulator
MSDEVRIVIADDHPLFRKGLRDVIESEERFKVLFEAGDGKAALQAIELRRPHVAVLDVEMPKMNGLDIARTLRDDESNVKVIILTMYDDEDMFHQAMEVGVMGYVLKDSAVSDIVSCISSVVEEKPYISPAISHYLVKRPGRDGRESGEKDGLESLTPTERTVLKLVANGKSTNEIAEKLFISPKTVENHRHNMCEKLGISGTNALLKYAMEKRNLL